MARPRNKRRISRKIGTFRNERCLILAAIAGLMVFAGWVWLEEHPQHNPLAPLDLRDPVGMATAAKLAGLRDDMNECRAVLDRSRIAYTALPPAGPDGGETACARPDRTQLTDFPLAPSTPPVTCPVAAALELWRVKSAELAARDILGSEIARIEHLGAYNCRRIRGSGSGGWSQHATANAIDIAAFILVDGRRISVLDDWDAETSEAQFLRAVRDDACGVFATVLSPDFNAAHADHFHFDQSPRWSGVCR